MALARWLRGIKRYLRESCLGSRLTWAIRRWQPGLKMPDVLMPPEPYTGPNKHMSEAVINWHVPRAVILWAVLTPCLLDNITYVFFPFMKYFFIYVYVSKFWYVSGNRRENSESRTICVNGLYSKQTRANAEKEYTLAESNTAIIETWAGNIQWRTDGTSLRSTNHLTSHALRQKQSLSSKTDQTTPIFFLIVSAS